MQEVTPWSYYRHKLSICTSTARGGGGSFKNKKPIGEIEIVVSHRWQQKTNKQTNKQTTKQPNKQTNKQNEQNEQNKQNKSKQNKTNQIKAKQTNNDNDNNNTAFVRKASNSGSNISGLGRHVKSHEWHVHSKWSASFWTTSGGTLLDFFRMNSTHAKHYCSSKWKKTVDSVDVKGDFS